MRSLKPQVQSTKLDELHSALCIEKVDISSSDMWLDDTVSHKDVELPDYKKKDI